MLIIRPICSKDYDALWQIAHESGHGFTSLPENQELLSNRIARSEQSFATEVTSAGDQGYLFVLEDTETGQVLGTSGIEAAVGMTDAFYHYHMGKVVHSSPKLNIYNTVDKLLSDKNSMEKQVNKSQKIISNFKTKKSSKIASSIIESYF